MDGIMTKWANMNLAWFTAALVAVFCLKIKLCYTGLKLLRNLMVYRSLKRKKTLTAGCASSGAPRIPCGASLAPYGAPQSC